MSKVNGIYDNEDGDNIPCKVDDEDWMPVIEISTGTILNWEVGKTAEIKYKVERLEYKIMDIENEIVFFDSNAEIPNSLKSKKCHKDCITMNISENGQIEEWKFNIKEFQYYFMTKMKDYE